MSRSLVGGLGLTLAALTLGLAWSGGWSAGRGSVARASTDPETSPGVTGQPEGLVVRLSEVPSEAPPAPAETVAPSRPLSDAEAEKVLDRLPPLHVEEEDERPFALRDKSLPPPRTGATVKEPFPPSTTAPGPGQAVAAGALEVVRRAPEGEVPLAPQLSVTFSQPMVPVTSQDVAAEQVPVRLQPQVKGQWRWVGTKTLLFEPQPRFPMATEFTAEIPAGTRSATGGTLKETVRWTFGTPAPRVLVKHPEGGPSVLRPLIFVGFDQRVDAAAMLHAITVKTRSGQVAVLRQAREEAIEADPEVQQLVKRAEPGRWVALRPEADLPGDTVVSVTVGRGAPSAEGPRVTSAPQSWAFRTFGPMKITEHRCGWQNECRPMMPWQIRFSNEIDTRRFEKDMVRIEPEMPDLKVTVAGQWLTIQGQSRGRTTYRVTLAAGLPDVYGQTLGAPQSVSFTVGPAEPVLWSPRGGLVTLDPGAPSRYAVYSINQPSLQVSAYRVQPSDWQAFRVWAQRRNESQAPPGQLAFSRTVRVEGDEDAMVETGIDLSEAFTEALGQVVLDIKPQRQAKERWRRQDVRVWVQSTRIGLTAFADEADLLVWATSLADGRPLDGVELSLAGTAGDAATGATAADGRARLTLPSSEAEVLVGRSGKGDLAILPRTSELWGRGWQRGDTQPRLVWHVFDDRGLYKPGEEVRVKGWVRQVGVFRDGNVMPKATLPKQLTYVLNDSRGNKIGSGSAAVDGFGGFEATLELPETVNLGDARLQLTADGFAGGACTHPIPVQEFRRPEFEVKAQASEGPYVVGDHATVMASARYYAGGGLMDAPVRWDVSVSPGEFVPPNRGDFTFGHWVPWWMDHGDFLPDDSGQETQTLSGQTDVRGEHTLRMDFDAAHPPRAWSVEVEASIEDVNRQEWTSSATLLVHPALVYVGLRSERYFVQQGQPLDLSVIAVDLDGKAVAERPVTVRAERLDWEQVAGEWKEKAVEPQEVHLTSGHDASRISFATPKGGTYRITAQVTDDQGRVNETVMRLWVAGGKQPPQRGVDLERVTLIPATREVHGGEIAEVLVMAPFENAEGLLTLQRTGLLRSERFSMKGTSHTLRIPIEEGWTPNVHVQVDLLGKAPRDGDAGGAGVARPAHASGSIDIAVPPRQRTLTLDVAPRDRRLEPGDKTELSVGVRDSAGHPVVGGQVTVFVADEAVLAVAGYELADPITSFYYHRVPGVDVARERSTVVLEEPELQESGAGGEVLKARAMSVNGPARGLVGALDAAAPMAMEQAMPAAPPMAFAGAVAKEEAAPTIALRSDFNPLALFVGGAVTDADGRVTVPVKLPDNLTRYRVMAVATDGKTRFGKGESTITARLPLMVRPSAPRFLNFGDRFELPIVVQNQTDAAMTVDVAARASNAELPAEKGRHVEVPANDRVEVRLPAAAARAGKARFQVGAVSGRWSDAAEVSLPVWTPATTEAFATYGQIDAPGAITQPVKTPPNVVRSYGGLEVTTSSTAVQALTDAVVYLVSYPFECAEQLSSRILGVAALKDVLTAFKAEGLPAPEDMKAAVARDLERLKSMQNPDGGFGFWRRGDESWPYVSIHAANAMVRAKSKGFAVDQGALARSGRYLKSIESHIPSWYGAYARRTLVAYALNVRLLMGDRDAAAGRGLVHEAGLEGLSFEAIGWLLPVLSGDPGSGTEVAEIRRFLSNRATETASTAHFAVDYGDSDYVLLYSNRRADGIVLDAIIGDQPKNDLIPKLVEGLLAHRTAGRWLNTQENVFILLALDHYFNTYEKTTPDFVARAWLGDRYAGEHAFRGRTTERSEIDIPMRFLQEGKTQDLILAKQGTGRLYYRVGMSYAPADLKLEPADRGFTVTRRYEGADAPDDVTREKDGTWRIKAGARVRVELSMVATSRRYHVALVDPLPAGLEPLNPALATTGTLPEAPGEKVPVIGGRGLGGPGLPGWWWLRWRRWWEHQNMRDERVEAFASLLFEGVYTYSYIARATTPGDFVVPPPKAEEMYHPETFGRGGSDRVEIK